MKPFAVVKEALAAAHEQADVVVVSSANPEAVREEWRRFGLLEHVDLLCTQEMGSKAYCISRLKEKGYDAILMCGDAPGDEQARPRTACCTFPSSSTMRRKAGSSLRRKPSPAFWKAATPERIRKNSAAASGTT